MSATQATVSIKKHQILVYTKTVDSFFHALWLATRSVSEHPMLFTDSPPVPPSERRLTRVSYERNGFPASKLLPRYTKKKTKFGLEVLTGKALSFWLKFIDETGEKVFCLQCKLSRLSLALVYVVDLFINKLNTEFNNLFYRMFFSTKRNHNAFLKKFPCKSSTNAFKSFVFRQQKSTTAAVRSLRAKIVNGNSKWVKNHHFCAQLSHCFSIYWNSEINECRWLVVCIYLAASLTTSHFHFGE